MPDWLHNAAVHISSRLLPGRCPGLQGGSGEQYFVGAFDGARFVNDNPASTTLWTDYGKDCYCALTFNNLPRTENPVMLGWMNNWQYAGNCQPLPGAVR